MEGVTVARGTLGFEVGSKAVVFVEGSGQGVIEGSDEQVQVIWSRF
jgi:hypothetical protein